ncbi:MAG TPA: ABC transporter permease [Alphaproteobacteria bacterium]|nr:ABC transporter permease [Alphaproteobacteria bacterium]
MLSFTIRRLISLIVTLLAAALVVFVVLEILPGDPAAVMLGVQATPETLAAVRAEYGLDKPVPVRFVQWIAGLVTGDLGISYTYRVPVSTLILERLAVTVPLALIAIALSTAIAIPLGVFAAARHAQPADAGVMVFSQIGVAIPNFWFALLLVLLFSITLGWAPSGGFPGWASGAAALGALALPAISLALPQAAILARVTRSSVLDALGEDWVRTARAKGLTRAQTLRGHVLRNALIPVVTIMGLQFSFLLAGAIIIENVFYLPGLGRLVFQAINQRDLIVVRDIVVLLAGLVIVINFVVDLLYAVIDPRLRTRR